MLSWFDSLKKRWECWRSGGHKDIVLIAKQYDNGSRFFYIKRKGCRVEGDVNRWYGPYPQEAIPDFFMACCLHCKKIFSYREDM